MTSLFYFFLPELLVVTELAEVGLCLLESWDCINLLESASSVIFSFPLLIFCQAGLTQCFEIAVSISVI